MAQDDERETGPSRPEDDPGRAEDTVPLEAGPQDTAPLPEDTTPLEPDQTAPLPPDTTRGTWSGRAAVPTGGPAAPTEEWTVAPAGSTWWMPMLIGAVAILLLSVLGVGVWLIASTLSRDPEPAAPPASPSESVSPTPSQPAVPTEDERPAPSPVRPGPSPRPAPSPAPSPTAPESPEPQPSIAPSPPEESPEPSPPPAVVPSPEPEPSDAA